MSLPSNDVQRRELKRPAPNQEPDAHARQHKRVGGIARKQHAYLELSDSDKRDEHDEHDEVADRNEGYIIAQAAQAKPPGHHERLPGNVPASETEGGAARTHHAQKPPKEAERRGPAVSRSTNQTNHGHEDRAAEDERGDEASAWSAPVSWRPYGRYRREPGAEMLGEGGFAIVHRVLDLIGGRHRARKRLQFEGRPSKLQLSEIKILTALQCHTNIVELLDICYTTSKIDIIMPIYQDSLFDLLHDSGGRELRFGKAKDLTRQLIHAVSHVHRKGFVHLDIKPANIMIDEDGRLKLGDFGLAVKAGHSRDVDTVGTYGYAAPECLLGSRRPTFQNDVWSAGCVIAEMFTGQPLFAFDTAENALRDILRFIGHPGGPVLPRLTSCVPDDDLPITWNAYHSNASTRMADVVPQAASIISEMLILQPNKRPHLATFLQHSLFTFNPSAAGSTEGGA